MTSLRLLQLARKALVSLDLRFSPSDEAIFKKSMEADMVRFFCYAAWISVTLSLFASAMRSSRGSSIQTWDNPIYFRIFMATQVVNVICSMFGWARLKRGCLLQFNWELFLVFLLLLNIVSASFFNKWWGPLLLGEEPEQASNSGSLESYMLFPLYIDVVLTGACLLIPFRTCVLWVLSGPAVVYFYILNVVFHKPIPGGNVLTIIIMALAMVSFFGAYRNERMARKEWCASQKVTQQGKELVNRHAAASAMLECFCDAVVHMGAPPSFCILDPNPRLASMLLCTDEHRLQGKSISNFIASEEDYSRMVEALQGEDNSQNVALNIHLRDSSAREFAVTAYFSRFCDFGNDPHYVVGLVEPQERGLFSMMHSAAVELGNSMNRSADALSVSSGTAASSFETYSGPTSFPFICDSINHLFCNEVAIVWVNAWTPDLVVVQCNSRFAALCGPSSLSSPLNQWILRKQSKERLSTLADDIVQHCVNSGDDMEGDLDTLLIKPPGMPSLEYMATCIIRCKTHCEDLKEGGGNHGIINGVEMLFILKHIKMRRRKPSNEMVLQAGRRPASPERLFRRTSLSL